MVAAKRIKQLVQLSAVGLVLLTFLIFVQWEDVSSGTRLKRRVFGEQDDDESLADLERELDVDRILKEVQKNVSLRLEEKELQRNKVILNHRRRLVHNGNGSEGLSDSLVNTTFQNTLETADARPKVSHPRNKPLKDTKASREQTHRRHLKNFKWQTEPWGSHMFGQLNVHVWQGWCGNTIHDLRRNWFFPLYPDLRLTVSRFYVTHYEKDYGQRIFGYLHPPLTGKYLFAISSDDSSELWLSSDEHPENVKPVGWIGNKTSYSGRYRTNIAEFTKYNTQLSRQIYLKKGQKYFIEALHKQGARLDHILVGWKIPGLPGFRYITGNSISLYIYDANASPDVTEYSEYIPQTLASHTHSHNWSVVLDREVHKFGTNKRTEDENHRTRPPLVNFNNLFYRCIYNPSYLVKNFTLRRYEGVGLIHDSAVYPDDNTALTHMRPFDKCGHRRRSTDSHGNDLNIPNSKPGKQSLYDEGSIKVFGSDGEGSVVTTPSDLTDALPIEGDSLDDGNRLSSGKPIERSLQERVRIVVDVYKDTNSSTTETQQEETIQFNDPRKSFHGNRNQLDPRNNHHGNINQFQPRNNNNMNSIQFKHRNSNHGNDNSRGYYPGNDNHNNNKGIAVQKEITSRHRGAIMNLAKKIHDRYRREQRASRDANDARDVRSHIEQAVLRDAGQPNRRQSPIIIQRYVPSIDDKQGDEAVRRAVHAVDKNNQDSQPVSRDSQPFYRDSQPVNQDSQPVNQDSQPVRQGSQPVHQDSQPVNEDSQPVRQVSQPVHQDSQPVNEDSQPVRQVSQPVNEDSQPVRQDSQPVNQDSQPVNQESQPVRQDSQPVHQSSEQDNRAREDPKRRATLRKLMFVSEGQEQATKSKAQANDEDDDGDGAPVQPSKSLQIGKDIIYFRPGISTNASVLSRDSTLQRIYSAREYIRRMQKVVQIYKYDVTRKQLSDQIYRRFGIRMQVPELRFYSEYNPWLYHHNITKCGTDGNILLNEDVAHSVVMRYMKSVERQRPHQFRLERIINIQENHDIINGDRYLIELELFHHETNQKARVSQYVYQEIGYADFCSPQNLQIHHHATVHVIIPVKNQGRWVQYFIDDMSELYVKTGDPHLNVIIVDFSSDDINIQEALKRSPLVRYRVITLTGPFQRAFGIQAGAAVITNPNDIIFMCDLHLEIPNNMIDIIRKHSIQGRMAFAPIVLRLHCGFTPTIPYGFWELQGYGLFAMYKSDFDRVGGMNYREFGTRWGGEDWELLDRVLLNKMEVERLRVPNFYHFYHSKKGMWGSPTIDIVHSDIGAQYYRNKIQIIPLYRPRPTRKTKIYDSRAIIVKDKPRNLRMKRAPSRIVRQSSRFRRGYRPNQKSRGTDSNGARIYY